MRITAEERRIINRRLKDRLAPAARIGRFPTIVLIVTTTLFVSPAAWARVEAGQARAMIITSDKPAQEKEFVKQYTKEELGKSVPANPMVGLDQRLAQEVTGVINHVSASFAGHDQQVAIDGLKTLQPEPDVWHYHIAALREAPKTRHANMDGFRGLVSSETQKAATNTVKSRFDFINKLGAGFGFNLNLKSLFGGKDKAAPQVAQPTTGTVRYGLVVKDIVPDMSAPKRAAIGSSVAQEMEYAGHAEVKWTIGPLHEKGGRPVFAPVQTQGQNNVEVGTWEKLLSKLPSPNFTGTIAPEGLDNFATVDKNVNPAWRVNLAQEQGLYHLSYLTSTKGERLSVEHTFKVPVAGTIEVGRRFSDNWDVVQTSAYNILYDKRMPILSVHHMAIEKRYVAEAAKAFGPHHVSVYGRSKAHGIIEDEATRPEHYAIGYERHF